MKIKKRGLSLNRESKDENELNWVLYLVIYALEDEFTYPIICGR